MNLKIDWSGRSHFYTKKEKDYLLKIIDKSDVLTHGPELDRFETGLKNYLKVNNIFVLNSAASALELIAELLSLKKGDEVIVPAHTYCASAIAFARNGAKIIWADLDLKTRTINFEDVKNKITKKTKAVVIVHLYGYAVDVEPFIKIARKKKIKIIEDCAQAFGAEIKKKKVGTLGDFSCYSFHAQKNFTTLGEGGAIYVKNNSLAKKIKGLRHNGHRNFKSKRKYYWLPAMGNLELDLKNYWPHKFSITEMQCAAGNMLLKRVEYLNSLRIIRAKKLIKAVQFCRDISFNEHFSNNRHVYHLLSAYVHPSKNFNRDLIINYMHNKFGIKCIVQYYPLYKYPLFIKMGLGKANCPNTEIFFNNMISFPFHIHMSEKDFSYLIISLLKTIKHLKKNFYVFSK